jgi:hypothetical protein
MSDSPNHPEDPNWSRKISNRFVSGESATFKDATSETNTTMDTQQDQPSTTNAQEQMSTNSEQPNAENMGDGANTSSFVELKSDAGDFANRNLEDALAEYGQWRKRNVPDPTPPTDADAAGVVADQESLHADKKNRTVVPAAEQSAVKHSVGQEGFDEMMSRILEAAKHDASKASDILKKDFNEIAKEVEEDRVREENGEDTAVTAAEVTAREADGGSTDQQPMVVTQNPMEIMKLQDLKETVSGAKSEADVDRTWAARGQDIEPNRSA